MVEQRLTDIVHISGVITGKGKDIAASSLDAIQLKFEIDRPAVVFNPHQINNRSAVFSDKMAPIT
jgi:hypothetical protein